MAIAETGEIAAVKVGDPERSKQWKIVKTIFLVLVWLCLGLYLEITGPTLKDLMIRTDSNYEQVSTAVSGRSVGYFIGSALGGLLVDKLGRHCDLMVAICMDGGALATVAIPWVQATEMVWLLCTLQGTFEGVINIAGQKLIIDMWKEGAASPLHILHGGFGIGSFIIPLIANPFLAVPADRAENVTVSLNSTTALPYYHTTMTTVEVTNTAEVQRYVKESRIEYAYLISALITIGLSSVFYWYHITAMKQRRAMGEQLEATHTDDINNAVSEKGELQHNRVLTNEPISFTRMFNPAACAGGRFWYGLQIFIMVFIYFFNAVGGERVAGKFIRAFAIDRLGFSTDNGSYINTTFWISFAIGRFTGFLTARWVPIRILILLETGGCLVTAIVLAIFGGNSSVALWVLIQPMGFFIAPLFPSGIGWANFHIMMTGVAITVFLLGGSLGGVAYMKLIGYMYNTYGPMTFLYTLLGYGIAVFVMAIIMDVSGVRPDDRLTETCDIEKEIEMSVKLTDAQNNTEAK